MADLDKLPVPLYDPEHPYHHEYDNLPLEALKTRDEIMNGEIETHGKILRSANGTQGTLANRLNQSINEDGSLKSDAMDEALHNIAEHTDGTKELTDSEIDEITSLGYTVENPVPFVRMLEVERDKLANIASEATNMTIEVEGPSTITVFDEGPVRFVPSSGFQWEFVAPNKIKASLTFSTEFAHNHYYDVEPITSNYQDYKVTSVNTPYIEDSLRVYINGFRLTSSAEIYVPGDLPTDSWGLNSYTEDPDAGTFTLSETITEDDVIRIDFDVALV